MVGENTKSEALGELSNIAIGYNLEEFSVREFSAMWGIGRFWEIKLSLHVDELSSWEKFFVWHLDVVAVDTSLQSSRMFVETSLDFRSLIFSCFSNFLISVLREFTSGAGLLDH